VRINNRDGLLKPGMNAEVNIAVGSVSGVLAVPNAALRIRPTAEMLATAGVTSPATRTARGNHALLWTLGTDNTLHAIPVQTGVTDGQRTEVMGDGVSDGMAVITALPSTSASAAPAASTTPSTNPFQPSRGASGGRAPRAM
jgi:HlyD family secretion protein